MKVVNASYLSQWDNPVAKAGSCNVTATAMALSAFSIVGSQGIQHLPEELRHWIEDVQGGDRHDNQWLKKAIEWKGLKDDFREHWTLSALITALDAGKPIVLDTWLSQSGHYILLKGYDTNKQTFIINDSNGLWSPNGYDEYASGESVQYSQDTILSAGLDANSWLLQSAFPAKPLQAASFAAHVISR